MILIGIDTGVKTGYAHSIDGIFQEITTETILSAQDKIHKIHEEAKLSDIVLVVCIEDTRKRKWVDPRIGGERLKGIGSVNRDCGIWQEFCERYGIRHLLIPPSHIETKLKAKAFEDRTGWTARTSEHGRDAGMIIHKYYRLFEKGVVAVPDTIKPKRNK